MSSSEAAAHNPKPADSAGAKQRVLASTKR